MSIALRPDKINTIAGHDPDGRYYRRVTSAAATPLATLRKRKLLSQRALARAAGVALSTIYLLEAGRTERVTFKVMRAISEALEVPPEAIAEFRRALNAD